MLFVALSFFCLCNEDVGGSEASGGILEKIMKVVKGEMTYGDVYDLLNFSLDEYLGVLDKPISQFVDINISLLEEIASLNKDSTIANVPSLPKEFLPKEYTRMIECFLENVNDIAPFAEIAGYKADDARWILQTISSEETIRKLTVNQVLSRIGFDPEPIFTDALTVFKSLVLKEEGKVAIRQVLKELEVSDDAINDIDQLLKGVKRDAKIQVAPVLRGVAGAVRAASEVTETSLLGSTGLIRSVFDWLFAHPLNFVDYPLTQRLSRGRELLKYLKNQKCVPISEEALTVVDSYLELIEKNGLSLELFLKPSEKPGPKSEQSEGASGSDTSSLTYFLDIIEAFLSGSTYDLLVAISSITHPSVTPISEEDFNKFVNEGEISLEHVVWILQLFGVNESGIIDFFETLGTTPVRELVKSVTGFDLTGIFGQSQDIVNKFNVGVDTALSTQFELPDQLRERLAKIAKIGNTPISGVLNEMGGVDYFDEVFILTGEIMNACMVPTRVMNDWAMVFKPFIKRLVIDPSDRLVAVLRRGGFTALELFGVISPRLSPWAEIAFDILEVFGKKDAKVKDVFAVVDTGVLDLQQTFKNYVALQADKFTIKDLLYVITPNNKKSSSLRLQAESMFNTIHGDSLIKTVDLFAEDFEKVTLNKVEAETGLNVESMKSLVSEASSELNKKSAGHVDTVFGTHCEAAFAPLGTIVTQLKNNETVTVAEMDSALKEMTEAGQGGDDPGPNIGLIVGLTVLAVVVVGVVIGLVVYFVVFRKKKSSSSSEQKDA